MSPPGALNGCGHEAERRIAAALIMINWPQRKDRVRRKSYDFGIYNYNASVVVR
jgi:hypothetical protein